MQNLLKIIAVVLIGLSSLFAFVAGSFAESNDHQKKVLELQQMLQGKEYEKLYNYLMKADDSERGDANVMIAEMLYNGVLPSGVDRCGAVLKLEEAAAEGSHYVYSALDLIYGGDWAVIAALEGNREALYRVGKRMLETNWSSQPFVLIDKRVPLREASRYLKSAKRLGHPGVAKLLAETGETLLEDGEEIEFRQVICPVR